MTMDPQNSVFISTYFWKDDSDLMFSHLKFFTTEAMSQAMPQVLDFLVVPPIIGDDETRLVNL